MPAIGAAIASVVSTVGTAFAAGGFFTTTFGRLLLSVGLSALQAALVPKPRVPGIKTKVTQDGGTNPQAFPLLKYATAGTHVCPPMSHGRVGKTPNAFLTYVVLLSDVPGCTLSRLMINGEYVTLGTTADPDYGLPVVGDTYGGRAWVKVYDGSQTTADPMLLAKYGAYPERPWSSDMIGRGCAYAICTFRFKRSIYPGLPRVRFEMNGIPLYDPRKDTTAGGSGAHRWANVATWEATLNPMVAAYNVLRGIALMDGSSWGGGFAAADLPLANWFAAMNECDLSVSDGASGSEPQFRAGLEVSVDEEPSDVLAELLKACSGQIVELGGTWKVRVGPPGVPVFAMTDGDIVISRDDSFRPFPNFASSYNGAHATYPDPATGWESKEAVPYYNATYEAQDQGERLVADLNLVAVPFPAQVRRLMYAGVEEERRFRRHEETLPPDYAQVEPLDAGAWTSTANGYAAKVFEISGTTEDPMSGLKQVILRERDAADFSYPALPAPVAISIVPVIPAAQVVEDFAVSGISIPDATGAARRPDILMTWEPDLDDVTGILWEVRVQATGVVVASGSFQNVAAGEGRAGQGILASTAYEVRAQPVADRPVDWTAWLPVTTPATLITVQDLGGNQMQSVELGPFTRGDVPDGTVVLTLDLGAILPGQGWERRVSFEAQKVGGAVDFLIELQRRRAILGGGFGSWSVQTTFNVTSFGWDVFGSAGTISEPVDDFEYRLVVAQRPSVANSNEVLRNVYLTLVRITK